MAFVWLFVVWCLPPMLLLAGVAYVRRRTLVRVGAPFSIVKYLVTSAVDNAAFAIQGAGVTLLAADAFNLAPWAAGGAAGALYAVCMAYMALDVALFVQGGLRMQWQFVAFASALKDFARGKAWQGQALFILVASLTLALGAAALFARILDARGQTPDWELCVAIAVAMTTSAWMRRTLPVFFMYEWTHPMVVGQVKWLTGLAAKLRKRRYAHRRDSRGVPSALLPGCERSDPAHADYPLLRTHHSFVGPKHFSLAPQPGPKPHVVLLFLESFRAADVGALGAHHDVTPHFDALCDEGILWERFYATGTYTAPALTAAIYGVLPRFAGASLQMHMPPVALYGLPHLFSAHGYTTGFFSDGPMDWENKREFFLRNGYRFFFGPPSIVQAYPEATAGQWNFDDAYLMQFHAAWLAAQDKAGRPSFSTLLTVTNHHPFTAPPHATPPCVGDDVDAQSDYYNYLRTTQYTDACLGAYIADLKGRGLYDKTVFVILGDHGQQVTVEQKMDWSGQYNDSGVRVPLLIVGKNRLPQGKTIRELGSQVDLLPTLMDLFDWRGQHHAVGTSLVRRSDARHAITLHPWKPGLYVTRFGDFRYVHSLETQVAALYDIARDPGETRNVAPAFAEVFAAQHEQATLLSAWLETLYMHNAVVPFVDGGNASVPRLPGDALSAPTSLQDVQTTLTTLLAEVSLDAADKPGKARDGQVVPVPAHPPRTPHPTQLDVRGRTILQASAWRLCLWATWLPEDKRLRAAQLTAHHIGRVYLGEMTNGERTELHVLLARLTQAPAGHALPRWLVGSVPRFLAHFH